MIDILKKNLTKHLEKFIWLFSNILLLLFFIAELELESESEASYIFIIKKLKKDKGKIEIYKKIN